MDRPKPSASSSGTSSSFTKMSPPMRALNSNGEAPQTMCFEDRLTSHPHTHQLICGHLVGTRHIATCGRNCAPSPAAESKSRDPPFACPHPDCVKQAAKEAKAKGIFFQPQKSIVHPRQCRLVHLYGEDEQEDAQRVAEKTEQAQDLLSDFGVSKEHSRYRTREEQACLRKRSRSPLRSTAPKKKVDFAEHINVLAQSDAGFKIAMAFTGPGVRAKKHGRLKTRKEFQDEVEDAQIARALDTLQTVDPEVYRQRLKEARRREMTTGSGPEGKNRFEFDDREPGSSEKQGTRDEEPVQNKTDPGEYVCDGPCKEPLLGTQICCLTCAEDYCVNCARRAIPEKHHNHDVAHRVTEVWCKCKTTNPKYLVPCMRCEEAFHPGCHGIGAYDEIFYARGNDGRIQGLQADHRRFKEGKEFMCPPCTDFLAKATAKLSTGRSERESRIHDYGQKRDTHLAIERDRKEMSALEKQMEYYKPQQVVQKRVEIKKAKTASEKQFLEAQWAAKEAEQEDSREHDDDGFDLPLRPKQDRRDESDGEV